MSAEDFQNALVGTQNGKVKTTMKTFVDEYFERGFEQGFEKGRAEGLAKGRTESIYASIEQFLEVRFGSTPETLIKKINEINDYSTLEKVQRVAWKSASLEEFERVLDLLK